MQRLLIQYKSGDDIPRIQSYLESRLPYEVNISSHARATENIVTSKVIHLVVISTGSLSIDDLQQIKDLRSVGYTYPVLMLADEAVGLNPANLAMKHKIHLLMRPFELKALYGMCRKLMTARSLTPQVHRRYKTNQRTVVESFLSGDMIESHMFNLSAGGAYFEFASKPRVSVGDLVRMKINLPEMDKEHAVNGKIIWTTHKGTHSGGHGCGVMFVKGSDIYRQLLDKV